ncbi:hypothetical protein [Streptomyces aureocirculatus]|uniref:hypothetical protein n=1 Tax=Streptomyces aureocirculatus TaxID=67275 RepID=UPI000B282638|nr:hypothetical protein [Streptomyces aureocirculatus]
MRLGATHGLLRTDHLLLEATHGLRGTTGLLPSTTHRLLSTTRRLFGSTDLLPSATHQLLGAIPHLGGHRLPCGLCIGGEGPPDSRRPRVRVGGARLLHGIGRRGDGLGGRTLGRSPLPLRLLSPLGPMGMLRLLRLLHLRSRHRRLSGARLRSTRLRSTRLRSTRLRGLRLAPRALGTRHQQQVVVLGGVVGRVEEGVRGRRGDARLLHPACALRQSLARDLAGVGHAYPSPIG